MTWTESKSWGTSILHISITVPSSTFPWWKMPTLKTILFSLLALTRYDAFLCWIHRYNETILPVCAHQGVGTTMVFQVIRPCCDVGFLKELCYQTHEQFLWRATAVIALKRAGVGALQDVRRLKGVPTEGNEAVEPSSTTGIWKHVFNPSTGKATEIYFMRQLSNDERHRKVWDRYGNFL